MFYGWRPYVSAAERRQQAVRYAAKLKKQGRTLAPVTIEGRTIARSYWGKAWCDNLERYSDYENRMPRGRRYVRSGSVIDLQISTGRVTALVSGSEVYEIAIEIAPLAKKRWRTLVDQGTGQVGSLVELLRGQFARGVMEVLARPHTGLFPAPKEIELSCSCPDWASMCKHVAAALYGVGARLDADPSLFFTLRKVDERELVAGAAAARALESVPAPTLATDQLEGIFGIEMDSAPRRATPRPVTMPSSRRPESRAAASGSRKPKLCCFPGCKNTAAPRHGMFCAALHKGLSRARKDRYRIAGVRR